MFYALYKHDQSRPIEYNNAKTGQREFAVFATVERAYTAAVLMNIHQTVEIRPITLDEFSELLVDQNTLLNDLHMEQIEQM